MKGRAAKVEGGGMREHRHTNVKRKKKVMICSLFLSLSFSFSLSNLSSRTKLPGEITRPFVSAKQPLDFHTFALTRKIGPLPAPSTLGPPVKGHCETKEEKVARKSYANES